MTEDPTLSGPIESLQLMLRTLSMLDEELPTLVPDGIYGSTTGPSAMERYGTARS